MAAACGDGGGGDGVVVVVVEERRRSQAQRATATRPNTQIRAHRRAARITTKSESTVTGSTGSDDDVTSLRSLRGRVMYVKETDRKRRERESVCGRVCNVLRICVCNVGY